MRVPSVRMVRSPVCGVRVVPGGTPVVLASGIPHAAVPATHPVRGDAGTVDGGGTDRGGEAGAVDGAAGVTGGLGDREPATSGGVTRPSPTVRTPDSATTASAVTPAATVVRRRRSTRPRRISSVPSTLDAPMWTVESDRARRSRSAVRSGSVIAPAPPPPAGRAGRLARG